MKPRSLETSKRLQQLAREIRNSDKEVGENAAVARKMAARALAASVIMGCALHEVWELLTPEEFPGWLAEHCKTVRSKSAAESMRIAKSDLEHGAARAYIALGVLPVDQPCDCVPTPELRHEIDGLKNVA